ncbi:MAG TPA: replicative DNA helicase [Solirubrobacteraceae bacterium]|nr:replicative DNA helicase [Solirubrobacteraceae bacterium]
MSVPERTNGSNGSGANGAPPAGLVPPQSIEAEQSVLGAILLSDQTLYALRVQLNLQPDDFYRPGHAVIYAAMLALYEQSEPVDKLTVTEKLKQSGSLEAAGGAAAIEALAAAPPVVGNAAHYGKIVKEAALVRNLLTATYRIQQQVAERGGDPRELVDQAERAILEVGHDDRRKDFRKIHEVLDEEIEKLAALSEAGKTVTGTPSGFNDLDEITGGFQPGNLIILAARPSMGKCLSAGTPVYDPWSGARRRIEDVVAELEHGAEEAWVASLGPDLRLRPTRVTAGFRNGVRPVLRLTTKLGRRIEATANHPLLTIDGWRELGGLAPGDRIAVPRTLPAPVVEQTMPDAELVMLAALLADGNLTERTPRFCWGPDSPVVDEVAEAAEAMGARLHVPAAGWGTGTISTGDRTRPNPVRELCERHGIWGTRSESKFVPEMVFGLDRGRIARFLSVLYGCDGHVYASDRLWQVGYSTISERLARDVQHLLLRLGIVSKLRELRRPVYEGTGKVALEVLITGQEDLRAFAEQVAVCGKRSCLARVVAGLGSVRSKTNVDTVPAGIWRLVSAAKGERSWAEVSAAAGHPRNHNWHVGTRGVSRPQLAKLADAIGDEELRQLATSDVWWDEIVAVEPVGERETFDLTVPGDHNFVAGDVVVHNSALAANFLENAAVRFDRPAVMFSLEMSESELAQRFIASQGSIKGNDLRRGKVSWQKVTGALKALNSAPLWVDDSSDLSVLDIRAKARRLSTQVDGKLGLVVVDYLQLMRADSRSDSVVEQIGEISKGLKTLARELSVPVVALSQLNRAVEQRHDKRPMLSDLRSSGQIEQDADLVMFIYREEYYEDDSERQGEAELIIAKHRNGGLGTVPLVFQHEYPRFMPGIRDPDRYA